MRITLAVAMPAVLLLASPSWGGDNELLDKFKRQNEKGRDKLEAEIKLVLERAKELEKDNPVKAVGLLQDTRDRMLEKGLLTTREDRALAEPLWEKIVVLRSVLRGKQANALRASLADFKEYMGRMNEEFAGLRRDLVPYGKEAPPGMPAFFALINGAQAAGWLNEVPEFVVNATINDEAKTLAPGLVVGIQTPKGFYLYHPERKIYMRLSGSEFFMTAIGAYAPARRSGFWMPSEVPPPPPGFFRKSAGAVGAALFARSAGLLMATWGGPGGNFPDRTAASEGSGTARLFRDVTIEFQVQETFYKLRKEDQARIRNAVLSFLDRRIKDDPLVPDEIVRFADSISDILPDLRADAVAFAHQLNRFFEQNRPGKK